MNNSLVTVSLSHLNWPGLHDGTKAAYKCRLHFPMLEQVLKSACAECVFVQPMWQTKGGGGGRTVMLIS